MSKRNTNDTGANGKPVALHHQHLRLLTSEAEVQHGYQTLLQSFSLHPSIQPPRTVLITSTRPGEGKTTVAVNLALMAMLAGKRVLLIEGDLRRPRLHHVMGLDNKVGLGNLLQEDLSVQNAVQVSEIPPNIVGAPHRLSVITSGSVKDGPATLSMRTARLTEIFRAVEQEFELVLVDSPPALAVSDPFSLAPLVDGVILVLEIGGPEKDTQFAKERLERAGGRILGVVINRFNEKLHGPSHHPYYSAYSKDHGS